MRGVPWSRDGMIIVLDHYRNGPPRHKKYHSELVEIGELLGLTPSSIEFRISNYKARDPAYLGAGGRGMRGGGSHVDSIWNEFYGREAHLRSEAIEAWKRVRDERQPPDVVPSEETEYPEGHLKLRTHLQRERSHQLVREAKKHYKKIAGRLVCEVCGLVPEESYAERADAVIEAHHRIPLSELSGRGVSKVEDLAMVCANCHRVIHGKVPWLSISEAKNLVSG